MNALELLGGLLTLGGVLLFALGTLGLLRFPDLYTRLHAVAKADGAGLGLVCLGVALHWGEVWLALKLVVIWLLVTAAGAVLAHLVAGAARAAGTRPWEGS